MEVHAHSHTPKKKWTHYFWEFLMLFLVCSVASWRKTYGSTGVEHLRAKEFAKSLVKDLQNDISSLNAHQRNLIPILLIADSLLECSKKKT